MLAHRQIPPAPPLSGTDRASALQTATVSRLRRCRQSAELSIFDDVMDVVVQRKRATMPGQDRADLVTTV
jgi:hypothetical protein